MALINPAPILHEDGHHADWLARNAPRFACPDETFTQTFAFRWSVYHDHIRPTPSGQVVTEFLPEVPWAGPFNTISCAAGHHLYEGRWLHDEGVLDDYSAFWFGPDGTPRKYSFWAADAIYARSLVTGNAASAGALLDALVENYAGWEVERQDPCGLFWQLDDRDGMEYQIGGSGYRPTINSYLYGDARAIARLAHEAGRPALASLFEDKARTLKRQVIDRLWDPEAQFFKTLPTAKALAEQNRYYAGRRPFPSQPAGRLTDVRELQGLVPWAFHLPDQEHADAWAVLLDRDGFRGVFGPATAERRHRDWLAAALPPLHECQWRGSSWPFATAQTLTAMANLLLDYQQRIVTRRDYFDLLTAYAHSHRMETHTGDVPWIDESLHPDTGVWVTRQSLYARNDAHKDRGARYNHSTFCDLVITGLVGLRPRRDDLLEVRPLLPEDIWDWFCLDNVRYHDRLLTIVFDRFGDRYRLGAGLRVFVDGLEAASAPGLDGLSLRLGPAMAERG